MTALGDLLALCIDDVSGVITAIKPTQWGDATPCTEWDLRQLTQHVVYELLWLRPLLEGQTIEQVGDRFEGDILGPDPAFAFAGAASDAVGAASAPGALTATAQLSFGPTSGEDYIKQVLFDVTIHSWDIRAGAGADRRIDPALIENATAYAAREVENWRAGGALATAVEVGPNANEQDRLIALTGRRPDWSP